MSTTPLLFDPAAPHPDRTPRRRPERGPELSLSRRRLLQGSAVLGLAAGASVLDLPSLPPMERALADGGVERNCQDLWIGVPLPDRGVAGRRCERRSLGPELFPSHRLRLLVLLADVGLGVPFDPRAL
ncbi:twin-arginine translocation signal domain-containing protein [Brachybacterium alimentarium]|uniref:twin-arginine translocation signal domain-containing protein n=1 Tax=Brachybacterium alimentarium TaxID=47845 RepID=UPI003FD3829B